MAEPSSWTPWLSLAWKSVLARSSVRVMPVVAVADRAPVGGLRGQQDLGRLVHFGGRRRERIDDRADLVRVDAPHARVAQLSAGLGRRLLQR